MASCFLCRKGSAPGLKSWSPNLRQKVGVFFRWVDQLFPEALERLGDEGARRRPCGVCLPTLTSLWELDEEVEKLKGKIRDLLKAALFVEVPAKDDDVAATVGPGTQLSMSPVVLPEKLVVPVPSPPVPRRSKRKSAVEAGKRLKRVIKGEPEDEDERNYLGDELDQDGRDDGPFHMKSDQEDERGDSESDLSDAENSVDVKPKRTVTTKTKKPATETTCPTCNLTFKLPSYLTRHIQRVHEKARTHQCNKCDKSFFSKFELKTHQDTHADSTERQNLKEKMKEASTCPHCNFVVSDKSYLGRHIRRIHKGVRPYLCDQCPKAFFSSLELAKHKAGGHEKAFTCSVCGLAVCDLRRKLLHEMLKCKKSFTEEYLSSLQVTALNCEVEGCGELVPNKKDCIKRHKETHMNSTELVAFKVEQKSSSREPSASMCELCGKVLHSGPAELQRHIARVHDQIKRHFCTYPECGKGFFNGTDVKKHIQAVHVEGKGKTKRIPKNKKYFQNEEGLFQCPHCPATSARKTNLSHHVARTHLLARKHECPVCHYKFYNKKELERHKVRHEREGYTCPKCEQHFIHQHHFLLHKAKRICTQQFVVKKGKSGKVTKVRKKRNDFPKDAARVKQNRFHCELCDEAFYDKRFLSHHHKVAHSPGSDDILSQAVQLAVVPAQDQSHDVGEVVINSIVSSSV